MSLHSFMLLGHTHFANTQKFCSFGTVHKWMSMNTLQCLWLAGLDFCTMLCHITVLRAQLTMHSAVRHFHLAFLLWSFAGRHEGKIYLSACESVRCIISAVAPHFHGLFSLQPCCEGPWFTSRQEDGCDKGAQQSYLGPERNAPVLPYWFLVWRKIN